MKRQKPVPSVSFYVMFFFVILHVVAVDFLASSVLRCGRYRNIYPLIWLKFQA